MDLLSLLDPSLAWSCSTDWQRRKGPPGSATEGGEATPPQTHFRAAPGRLALSSLGLGTYIGPPDATTDLAVEHSVAVCLTSGRVNVLDTAINYRHQRAERSVGRALARLLEKGEITRDEVFLATKSGYFAPSKSSNRPDFTGTPPTAKLSSPERIICGYLSSASKPTK